MSTSKRRANIIFYQIGAIGLFFFALFSYLIVNLYNRLDLILSSVIGKLETICGCANHFSFFNHPILFTFLLLTGIGAIFFILFAAVKTVKLKRSTDRFIKANLNKRRQTLSEKLKSAAVLLDIEKKVIEIDRSDATVFCYGLIKAKICISSKLVERLSEPELISVLLHEQHHLIVREPLRLFILKILSKILFFLPGFRALVKQYYIFSELAADEWTVGHSKDGASLARAVYKVLKWREGMALESNLAIGSFTNMIEERINKMVDAKYFPVMRIFTAKFFINVLIILSLLFMLGFSLYSSKLAIASSEHAACLPGDMAEEYEIAPDESGRTMDCGYMLENSACMGDMLNHGSENYSCGQ